MVNSDEDISLLDEKTLRKYYNGLCDKLGKKIILKESIEAEIFHIKSLMDKIHRKLFPNLIKQQNITEFL